MAGFAMLATMRRARCSPSSRRSLNSFMGWLPPVRITLAFTLLAAVVASWLFVGGFHAE